MTDIEPTPNPLFLAHKAASLKAGKEASAAVIVKHGGHAGAGGFNHVPASKVKACIAELTALAGGKIDAAAVASFEAIRATAYGDKPRLASVKSFAELVGPAFEKFNNPPKKAT